MSLLSTNKEILFQTRPNDVNKSLDGDNRTKRPKRWDQAKFAGRDGERNLPISRAPAISSILSLIIIPILMGFFKDRPLQHPKKSPRLFICQRKATHFSVAFLISTKPGAPHYGLPKFWTFPSPNSSVCSKMMVTRELWASERTGPRPTVGKMVNQCQIKWKNEWENIGTHKLCAPTPFVIPRRCDNHNQICPARWPPGDPTGITV